MDGVFIYLRVVCFVVVWFDSDSLVLLFFCLLGRAILVLVLSGFGVVLKWFLLCFLVFLFFVFMSGLDFVVHRVLYGYGLWFSFDWAVGYWVFYWCVFLVFGVVVGFVYWVGSGRGGRDVRVGLGLFLSVFLLCLGGLQDVFWFVFWGGGLPSNGVVWWWMPWFGLFGFWDSGLQLWLLLVMCGVVGLVWVVVLG